MNRAPESRQLNAPGEPRRGRREPIASFERMADRRPGIASLGEVNDPLRRGFVEHRRQHPVVWRDEAVVTDVGGQPPTTRPDAGIDDDQEHAANRKVSIRGGQLERGHLHIVRWDVVGEINEGGVWADPDHHALHHTGVMVAAAKIAQQNNDRMGHSSHGQGEPRAPTPLSPLSLSLPPGGL